MQISSVFYLTLSISLLRALKITFTIAFTTLIAFETDYTSTSEVTITR